MESIGSNTPISIKLNRLEEINGDGQNDLIIGDADGKIHLFINNNGNFLISNPNLSNIDVGYFATPQIFDVNNDGLNDLIIGNKSGTIYYFENQGTSTNPDFPIGDPSWGNIDVDSAYINNGFSTPKLINLNGEVIGINTFIMTGSNANQGSIGIGFSIPINRVKDIVHDLILYGEVKRIYSTGLTLKPMNSTVQNYS